MNLKQIPHSESQVTAATVSLSHGCKSSKCQVKCHSGDPSQFPG